MRFASQDLQTQGSEAIERSQVVAVGSPLPTASLPVGAHQGPVMVMFNTDRFSFKIFTVKFNLTKTIQVFLALRTM